MFFIVCWFNSYCCKLSETPARFLIILVFRMPWKAVTSEGIIIPVKALYISALGFMSLHTKQSLTETWLKSFHMLGIPNNISQAHVWESLKCQWSTLHLCWRTDDCMEDVWNWCTVFLGRRTFFPEKCDLKSTCVLYAEGKYLFPNLWMSLHLLNDTFIVR